MLKAVHLEPIPFDIDRDLITPTFKLKRPQLLKYYKVLFCLHAIINLAMGLCLWYLFIIIIKAKVFLILSFSCFDTICRITLINYTEKPRD